jgi:predicted transposase/invertase (TIGR01784 family)
MNLLKYKDMFMEAAEKIDLLPPSSDFVFKGIFGKESHKRVLISLLNSILDGKPVIRDITLENTDIPKNKKKGKSVRLDIRATTDDSTKINIEVQCEDEGSIMNRSRFYSSKRLPEELKEGEEYDDLPKTIIIWLLNYNETKRKYHTHEAVYTFLETPLDLPAIASDSSRIILIELKKVSLKQASISRIFDVWMYFLKSPEKIPADFLTIEEVKEAMNTLAHLSQDPATRREYNDRLKARNDAINARSHAINVAKREAREAIQEAEEAKREAKEAKREAEEAKREAEEARQAEVRGEQRIREIARNMLSAGVDIKIVSISSGISIDELEKLNVC